MDFDQFFVSNLIVVIHLLIISFVLITPFITKNVVILFIHIIFSIGILIHWLENNNMCSMSVLEGKIRGIDYDKSFTHRIISYIYDIPKTSWLYISYLILVVVLSFSLRKLSFGLEKTNFKKLLKSKITKK